MVVTLLTYFPFKLETKYFKKPRVLCGFTTALKTSHRRNNLLAETVCANKNIRNLTNVLSLCHPGLYQVK